MSGNKEKNMELYIRYYSITTVPKEYTPHTALPEEKPADTGDFLSALANAKSEVSGLTPYLFVLIETENGGAYWQYIDLAGNLSLIRFTSLESYVDATKVVFPNGAYMYRINRVYLQR